MSCPPYHFTPASYFVSNVYIHACVHSGVKRVHLKFLEHIIKEQLCDGWKISDRCFVFENATPNHNVQEGCATITGIRVRQREARDDSTDTPPDDSDERRSGKQARVSDDLAVPTQPYVVELHCTYVVGRCGAWVRSTGIRRLASDDLYVPERVSAAKSGFGTSDATLSEAQSQVRQLQAVVDKLKSNAHTKQEELETLRQDLTAKIHALNGETAELKAKIATLTVQLHLKTMEHSALSHAHDTDMAKELQKRGILEEELEQLRDQERAWSKANDVIANKLLVAEGQLTHRYQDLEKLNTELERCKKQFDANRSRDNAEQKQAFEKLQRKKGDLERKVKDRTSHMVQLRTMCNELQVALRDAMVRESALTAELNQATKEESERNEKAISVLNGLLSDEEKKIVQRIKNAESIGARAGSVEEMGRSRRDDLARLASLYVTKVLEITKAGPSDVGGILTLVNRRLGASTASTPTPTSAKRDPHSGEHGHDDTIIKSLANAYKAAMRAGNKDHARTILSGLAGAKGLTSNKIMELCTDKEEVTVGTKVLFEESIPEAERGSAAAATVRFVPGTIKRMPPPDFEVSPGLLLAVSTCEPVLYGIERNDNGEMVDVHAHNVVFPRRVVCTPYQIKVARLHSHVHGPLAPVPKTERRARVERVRGDRAAFVVTFLRDPSVVELVEASKKNSTKGKKCMRVCVRGMSYLHAENSR